MRTIGLLGGMSWESTALYYRLVNQQVKARLGGLHSARVAMVSVDFEEIEEMQSRGEWDAAGEALAGAARRVEAAGADGLVLCTNTMHRVAPAIEAAIGVPLLLVLIVVMSIVLGRGGDDADNSAGDAAGGEAAAQAVPDVRWRTLKQALGMLREQGFQANNRDQL